MDKERRNEYLYAKKCLLILLFLYYRENVSYDDLILRSFGFHFDPTCNFKAIVKSKKEHIHKYTVHIYTRKYVVNLETMDVMGNVNILKVGKIKNSDDEYDPEASLNIYFDGNDFLALGHIEGKKLRFSSLESGDKECNKALAYRLNEVETNNDSAPSFLLWLMRFYAYSLQVDLVMGAGINKDYGAKDWSGLISSLNHEFFLGDEKRAEGYRHYVGDALFTSSMVLKTSGFDIYKSLNEGLYKFKEAKSFNDPDSTLYRCVDFIASHPGTNVITYNYDTNLEYLLKKRDLLYCAVYDDNSFVSKRAVCSIYHVHGLLPYERFSERKFTDSIIFDESDYYYLYNNPYSWNIAKQLHDFKFNVCFFIGISLTDPDMKRILELANNPLKFNFIFMKKEKEYGEDVYRDISTYFFTFDLITIWVDCYEEIGDWLKRL